MPIPNMNTNLQNGVTNVSDATSATLGSMPFPDPSRCHAWFSDFDQFSHHATNAALWLSTTTGSGTGALEDADGGILLITNGGSDNDNFFLQWSGYQAADVIESWKWESGKGMWFKARFKVSDATQSDFVMGLQITDTSPLAVTDGLYFQKDDGGTTLYFNATKDSTSTTITPVATIADDTYFTCGFWWDPNLGVMTIYYNDNPVGQTSTTTNFPDDEELTISFGIQNGEGSAKTMRVDYISVAKDRQTNFS